MGFSRGVVIHNAAPGRVDQERVVLYHFQCPLIDQVFCFIGQWNMQTYGVRGLQHLFKLDLFNALPGGIFRLYKRIISDDVHAQGNGPAGGLPGDSAKSDKAQGFPPVSFPINRVLGQTPLAISSKDW